MIIPIEDGQDDNDDTPQDGKTIEKMVSANPDDEVFVQGEHE